MTGPTKVTEKQLAANRRNARKSTGPRTPEGKASSRWNALKHGVLAKAVIPAPLEAYESREEFDALLRSLCQELGPASALEEMLVERIATSYWRLARVIRAEAAAIARRQATRPSSLDHLSFGQEPTLADRVNAFADTMSNKRRLRSLMAGEEPRWRTASDEELMAEAQEHLAALREQLAQEEAQEQVLTQAERSIPHLETAAAFARYEATLERQLYRALDALERIKRLRGGDFVPPPLKITIDNSSNGGP